MNRFSIKKAGALLALGSILLAGCEQKAADGPPGFANRPPPVVVVAPVQEQFLADEIQAIGTLRANESVVITAAVTEPVASVQFSDGQQVEQGDVLITLTSDEQTAELAEAEANLEDAKRQLQRLLGIGNQLASRSAIDEARAKVDANRGRLDAIQARLRDRLITAPFKGVLGFRQVSVGALVTPGTEITTLDDISTVKLDFTVPETYLGKVRLDNAVIGSSPAWQGQEFQGRVTTIDSRVDANTRAVRVRAEIDNPEHKLKPGMLMHVTLFTDQYPALTVLESALLQTGNRSSVYVVNDDSTVTLRDVSVVKRLPGSVVLSSGVEAGDPVVIDGTLNLRPGGQVRVKETDEPTLVAPEQPNSSSKSGV